jgi:hypothetical protein
VALVAFAFACKSTANVSDSSAPAADPACATECSPEMKAECEAKKADCAEGKTCPVTGAKIEN